MPSILDKFSLSQKVAVVTGAARGLGQGMALALAGAGADIVAVDIIAADDTKKQVEAFGRACLPLTANLGDRAAIPQVIVDARKRFDHLDILVNCAGIIRRADFTEFSEKDWDDVMGINIDAVFFLSQAFVRDAIARQAPAKIINIASMLSFQGGIHVASYTAAKSGLAGLTRLMANEWAAKTRSTRTSPGFP
jgi:2-deoxy-D-gluconate 3-dehydrogenase